MPAFVRLTDKEHTMVDEIAARATELLGQAEPVSRQPRKETLMSFREGHLFMALKLVTPFDKGSQTYLDPIPKIVLMVDGKYVRGPGGCRDPEEGDRHGQGPQEDEGGIGYAVRTSSGASPS